MFTELYVVYPFRYKSCKVLEHYQKLKVKHRTIVLHLIKKNLRITVTSLAIFLLRIEIRLAAFVVI